VELALVIIVVVVRAGFDYINGFHDAANSIATVVSTRVLSPGRRCCGPASSTSRRPFIFGTASGLDVGSGLDRLSRLVTQSVILAGLIGAIELGLDHLVLRICRPARRTRLIGAYAAAAIAKAGYAAIIPGGWTKTLIFIVLAR
jgi:PiT family inorganic phosphate transporter